MWRDDSKSDKTAEAFHEILEYRIKIMLVVAGYVLDGPYLRFEPILKSIPAEQLDDKEFVKSQEKATLQKRKDRVLDCLTPVEDTFFGQGWMCSAEPLNLNSGCEEERLPGHLPMLSSAAHAPQNGAGTGSGSHAQADEKDKEKADGEAHNPQEKEQKEAQKEGEEQKEGDEAKEEGEEEKKEGDEKNEEGDEEKKEGDDEKEGAQQELQEEGNGPRDADDKATGTAAAVMAAHAEQDSEDLYMAGVAEKAVAVPSPPQCALQWELEGQERSSQDVLQRLLQCSTCKPVARWKELKTMAVMEATVDEIRQAVDEDSLKQSVSRLDAAKLVWDELRQAGKRSVADLTSTVHKLELESVKSRKSLQKRSIVISEAEEKKQQKVPHMRPGN